MLSRVIYMLVQVFYAFIWQTVTVICINSKDIINGQWIPFMISQNTNVRNVTTMQTLHSRWQIIITFSISCLQLTITKFIVEWCYKCKTLVWNVNDYAMLAVIYQLSNTRIKHYVRGNWTRQNDLLRNTYNNISCVEEKTNNLRFSPVEGKNSPCWLTWPNSVLNSKTNKFSSSNSENYCLCSF